MRWWLLWEVNYAFYHYQIFQENFLENHIVDGGSPRNPLWALSRIHNFCNAIVDAILA